MEKTRIDKWLWAVRIFKTRTMASDACKGGKVKIEGANLKPSQSIKSNDIITVRKEGILLTLRVVAPIERRTSHTIAITCYTDLTPAEEKNKFKEWYSLELAQGMRDRGSGRPTKRDRRDLEGGTPTDMTTDGFQDSPEFDWNQWISGQNEGDED